MLELRGRDLVIGTALALAIYPSGHDHGEPQLALVELGLLVLSIGLSLLAGYLLQEKIKSPIRDEKPTTLTERGSYLNWHHGTRRLGPIFAWAGGRLINKESSGKKNIFGGDDPEIEVFYESGWHLVCVGPCYALHRILQNGKVIFQGPITVNSHPSGSFIDLGYYGGFSIYWGEARQAPNTFLGDASRVGITSRWPLHCYIEWRNKRLGPAPQWPLLDYEIEKRPAISESLLPSTGAFLDPTRTLSGATITILDKLSVPGGPHFVTRSNASTFRPDDTVRLVGNALPDQDLTVLRVESTFYSEGLGFGLEYRIYIEEDISGADGTGTLQRYEVAPDSGVNPAHVIAEMLFAEWPSGIGLATTGENQMISITSLDEAGVVFEAENFRGSVLAKGDTLQSIMGGMLQDLGMLFPLDPITGHRIFKLIREPSGTLPIVKDDMLVDGLPEVERFHGINPVDKLVFQFADRNIGYRSATIAVMDDGQIAYKGNTQRSRVVQIITTTYFNSASQVAQRRSQEELAHGSAITLRANRGVRELVPGDAFVQESIGEVLRVVGVKLDTESGVVTLDVLNDFYGLPLTPFVDEPPPENDQFLDVEPDLAFGLLEVPEYLETSFQTVIIPRIRAHAQVSSAFLHISRDNITYTLQGVELNLQTGGVLSTALSNTDGYLLDQGPSFTLLGPDVGIIDDLSSDLLNWSLGRQICVLDGDNGSEICFVKKVTALGGGIYRLDGLIRARYDTPRLTHPVGTRAFIFNVDEITRIRDPLLAPQVLLYAQTQPQAGGTLPLSSLPVVGENLYGKSVRPVPIGALRVTAPDLVNAYTSGDNVTLEWLYATPQTPQAGAGLQAAGSAISGYPDPDEDFKLEILTLADSVVRTETLASPTYTYTSANIVSDLGSEVSFKVRVTQRRAGLESDPVTITVEKF